MLSMNIYIQTGHWASGWVIIECCFNFLKDTSTGRRADSMNYYFRSTLPTTLQLRAVKHQTNKTLQLWGQIKFCQVRWVENIQNATVAFRIQ